MQAKPFTVEVADEVLDDLRARLARTRWPAPLPGPGWMYGVDREYLRELVGYWEGSFDWRARALAERLRPVHRRDRRPDDPLRTRAWARPASAPARSDAWLAELLRRAVEARAAAHRSGRTWRRRGRQLRRRRSLAARLYILGPASSPRPRHRAQHGEAVGPVDARLPRLLTLRRPGAGHRRRRQHQSRIAASVGGTPGRPRRGVSNKDKSPA